MTNSTFLSLNSNDFKSLLKNVLLFGLPIVLANIVPIQNYILSVININPDILAIFLGAICKIIELWLRNNKPLNPTTL